MKIALCLTESAERAERLVRTMLATQEPAPGCATRILTFAFGCLGLVGRPDEAPSAWPVWASPTGSFLAFTGLPIATGGPTPGPVRAGDAVVRRALAGDDPAAVHAALTALDGAFVAIGWDAARGTLTLVTDFLGMQPLYRAALPGSAGLTTLFASEVKALAQAAAGVGAPPTAPDAGAWGAMIYFGHQIGPRSLLAGAVRVPAAHVLTFTAPAAERASGTWTWPTSRGVPNGRALHDAIGGALRADVAAYAAAHPDATLLLSGGFDSRLILCLCREAGVHPRALIQSHPDENADADARFAAAFARALGVPARRVDARADFYGSDAYLRFLERNEIATPSLYLFIPNVFAALAEERRGVWEGLLLDPALKFKYGDGGFGPYLAARTGERRRAYEAAVRRVFAPAWAERMAAEYDDLLAAECARYSDDAEGVWQFSVLNRSRFRTGVNPYQVYDAVTPPLTPGMSKAFWEAVTSADPHVRLRHGKQLYRAVFDRLAPEGLRVPLASGSALVPGRGGAALYHTQRVRAAVQRLAKRPRVARALRSAGLPAPFRWDPSPFPSAALGEAALDDARLNADWIRQRRAAGHADDGDRADALALELLMYWQAWQHVMRGDLRAAWPAERAPTRGDVARPS